MAGSVNKVILIGNVGADPEIRRSQDGKPIANLRIATSESWRDRNSGERKEKTEWHTVVVFNEGIAKIVEQYVKKGSKLYLEGALQTRKWQDRDGNDRYSTEIILTGFNCSLQMLSANGGGDRDDDRGGYGGGRSGGGSQGSGSGYGGNAGGGSQRGGSAGSFANDLDDDIPF
ncbi:single-stranded DNA-binding protein [Agrobacterium deltaense]